MQNTRFMPTNPLESMLVDAQNGHVKLDDFLRLLMKSDVHVPGASEVMADGKGFQPLLFERDNNTFMAVFTARDRVRIYVEHTPYCLTMQGERLFEWIPTEYGIVINPGFLVGLEIPAKGVKEIYRDFSVP